MKLRSFEIKMKVKNWNIWNKDFTVQYLSFQRQLLLPSKHISSKKQKLSHKMSEFTLMRRDCHLSLGAKSASLSAVWRALSQLFLRGFPTSLCSLWCSFAELRAPRPHQAAVKLSLNRWGGWRATPALPVELGWVCSGASPAEELITHEECGLARSIICIPKSDANSPSFALPMVHLLCLELEQEGDRF